MSLWLKMTLMCLVQENRVPYVPGPGSNDWSQYNLSGTVTALIIKKTEGLVHDIICESTLRKDGGNDIY